jgi:hypothetical protein
MKSVLSRARVPFLAVAAACVLAVGAGWAIATCPALANAYPLACLLDDCQIVARGSAIQFRAGVPA